MDRRQTHQGRTKADTTSRTTGTVLLPSRQAALRSLSSAVERGDGPVLLTGEAGSGKTWLSRQMIQRTGGPALRWVSVDVPPMSGAMDLLRAIVEALGVAVEEPATVSSLRSMLTRLLSEQTQDQRSWGLILDEAHLAAPEALEFVRLLSNRIRQPEGFWAIVLVGQTALAPRLASWPMRSLEARLSARIHLGPIDADEARLLLGPTVSVEDAERRHRDSAGNPGRLLRLDPPSGLPVPRFQTARPARLVASEPAEPAPIVPTRPPLKVEDGVIEVGWDAEAEEAVVSEVDSEVEEPRVGGESTPEPVVSSRLQAAPNGEPVPVEDHYAALQAWNEWAANQRRGESAPSEAQPEESADDDQEDDLYPQPSRLRAEGDEEFAPYSQLFSRLSEEA